MDNDVETRNNKLSNNLIIILLYDERLCSEVRGTHVNNEAKSW